MHSITAARDDVADPRCTCLLLRRAARRVTQAYDDALRPAGLRTTQFSVLAVLRHAPEGLPIGELADRLSADRTTMTRVLKPLAAAGWVESLADPADRRRTRLRLTGAGRATLRTAAPLWRAAQRGLRARVGDARVDGLHAAIDRTLERIE